MKTEERQRLWQQEHMRIFFATPQTFWNDVKKGAAALTFSLFPAGMLPAGMPQAELVPEVD